MAVTDFVAKTWVDYANDPLLQATEGNRWEAQMAALDVASQPRAIDKDLTAAPSSPAVGATYIVPPAGWGGSHGNAIARWNGTTWDYYTPKSGWTFYVVDEAVEYRFDGTVWGIVLASSIRNVPHGNIASTNVQDAINELDEEKESISTYTILGTGAIGNGEWKTLFAVQPVGGPIDFSRRLEYVAQFSGNAGFEIEVLADPKRIALLPFSWPDQYPFLRLRVDLRPVSSGTAVYAAIHSPSFAGNSSNGVLNMSSAPPKITVRARFLGVSGVIYEGVLEDRISKFSQSTLIPPPIEDGWGSNWGNNWGGKV